MCHALHHVCLFIAKGGHPLKMSTLRPRFFIRFMNYVKKLEASHRCHLGGVVTTQLTPNAINVYFYMF